MTDESQRVSETAQRLGASHVETHESHDAAVSAGKARLSDRAEVTDQPTPLAVRCPTCDAPPWIGCLIPLVPRTLAVVRSQSQLHSERLEAWRAG